MDLTAQKLNLILLSWRSAFIIEYFMFYDKWYFMLGVPSQGSKNIFSLHSIRCTCISIELTVLIINMTLFLKNLLDNIKHLKHFLRALKANCWLESLWKLKRNRFIRRTTFVSIWIYNNFLDIGSFSLRSIPNSVTIDLDCYN